MEREKGRERESLTERERGGGGGSEQLSIIRPRGTQAFFSFLLKTKNVKTKILRIYAAIFKMFVRNMISSMDSHNGKANRTRKKGTIMARQIKKAEREKHQNNNHCNHIPAKTGAWANWAILLWSLRSKKWKHKKKTKKPWCSETPCEVWSLTERKHTHTHVRARTRQFLTHTHTHTHTHTQTHTHNTHTHTHTHTLGRYCHKHCQFNMLTWLNRLGKEKKCRTLAKSFLF